LRLTRALFRKTPWSVVLVLLLSVSVFAVVVAPFVTGGSPTQTPVSPNPTLAECAGGTDLSTGTNGTGTASRAGINDTSWYLTNTVTATGGIGVTVPAFSKLHAVSPSIITTNGLGWISISGGRFSWISPAKNPTITSDTNPGGHYIYAVTFTATVGGTFYLYEFSSDSGPTTLTLTGPSGTIGSWAETTNGYISWWPTTTPSPLVLTKGGTYTLTADVYNTPSPSGGRATGLAVYAVYCSPWPWSTQPSWVYTANFVCNTASPSAAPNIGLEPGLYDTSINILNPSFSTTSVQLVEKFVVTEPQSASLNPPQARQAVSAVPVPYAIRWIALGPDAAVGLACSQIQSYLGAANVPKAGDVKGFVEIFTNSATDPKGNLDVRAEYSASSCIPNTRTGACITSPLVSSLQQVQISAAPYTP